MSEDEDGFLRAAPLTFVRAPCLSGGMRSDRARLYESWVSNH